MTCPIKKMPEAIRPRERLVAEGEEALSPAELLAILLGSGTPGRPVTHLAEELLTHFGNLTRLADASIGELTQIPGVGPAKAVQLRAAFALAQRLTPSLPPARSIRTSAEAYALLRPKLEGATEERILLLLHNAKGQPIGTHLVSVGTLTRALAHPREIFAPAIRHRAAALTVAHNHPSGDPTPSDEDIALTRKLLNVSRVLEMPLFDHLVIGRGRFTSIREQVPGLWK
ncbi:MAG: DNA repair protein RadC [Parachlamydiales bacterium]